MKIKNRDYKYFEMARKEALVSDFNHFHIGCVIVYKGHVIGQGSNMNKTDPMQKKYNHYRKFNRSSKPVKHSIHAEISALKSIPYPIQENIDWKKVDVYVYRISPGKDLGQGLARPCISCMNALRDKGIQNIYYSTEDGYAYEHIF